MRSEKLLDAIGNIDDKLIEDASPMKQISKKRINWIKWGSLAACFCVILIAVWGFDLISFNNKSFNEAALESESAPMAEESVAEDELPAKEAVAEEAPAEDAPAEEEPAEEAPAVGVIDIAYGFILNDREYYPISFEERKQFGLVSEHDTGLTAENTYRITKADLGEIMGTIESSADETLIGATVYHFAKFPEDNTICIVEHEGSYEFYTCYNASIDNEQ